MSEDSLSKRVARFLENQPKRRSGKARAAVIALREEIQRALADGWSVLAIWQTLQAEGAVKVGYHAFRRHVADLVIGSAARPRAKISVDAAESSVQGPAADRPAPPPSSEPRRFRHERVPRKDKIYG